MPTLPDWSTLQPHARVRATDPARMSTSIAGLLGDDFDEADPYRAAVCS